MRTALFWLAPLFVACATPDVADVADVDANPWAGQPFGDAAVEADATPRAGPPPVLDLCKPAFPVPGERFEVTVSGAPPGAQIALGGGTGTSAPYCPAFLRGDCFDISNPVLLGRATADASGVATFRPRLPANAPVGLRLQLQAVYLAGANTALSNAVSFRTLSDASLPGYCLDANTCASPDADGDGVTDQCEVPGCTDPDASNYVPGATDPGACLYPVTFQLDMSCYPDPFSTAYVTGGAIDGWCGSCTALADQGGGLYAVTLDLPPGDYDYKYTVDGWPPAGIEESLGFADLCVESTDNFSYANRQANVVDAPLVEPLSTFDSCFGCNGPGGPFDVTFELDTTCYGGAANPAVDGVYVLGSWNGFSAFTDVLTDPDLDGVYTGVVSLDPGTYEYIFHIGSDFENLVPVASDSCIVATDFSSYANRGVTVLDRAVATDAASFGGCTLCGAGCTDTDAANYDAGATSDDGSCTYAATFALDLRCETRSFTRPYLTGGNIDGWCGSCTPLSDADGDGIWTTTLVLAQGFWEYKYTLDGWSGVQENILDDALSGNDACVGNTDYANYANRAFTVTNAPVTAPGTFDTCTVCVP